MISVCKDILTFTRMEGFSKLSKISAKFRENTKLYLFIDLDLSLILDNHWKLLSGTFSENGKMKNTEIDKKYMEKHVTKNLTEDEELSWMSDKIQLFKEEKVHLGQIRSVANIIKLRRNAKTLIDIFRPENTIIISNVHHIPSKFIIIPSKVKIIPLSFDLIPFNVLIISLKDHLLSYDDYIIPL